MSGSAGTLRRGVRAHERERKGTEGGEVDFDELSFVGSKTVGKASGKGEEIELGLR